MFKMLWNIRVSHGLNEFQGMGITSWLVLTLDYSVVLSRRYILRHIWNLLCSPNPWLENNGV
jgi:hypothetical protein